MVKQRLAGVTVASLVVVVALSGCFGTQERTEWAYSTTGLEILASNGKTGAGILVAVLDTGVDTGHPSLAHLTDGDDTNGELKYYRDFLGGSVGVEFAEDPDGHGTHVIGIMSARKGDIGNQLISGGVALHGASPEIQLLVARVCTASGCDADAIVDAVRWATGRGADIISLSLGGNPNVPGLLGDALSSQIEDAINDAISRGVVVVAAAGNSGSNAQDVASPGNIPGVIAVGAVNSQLQVWTESNGDGSQRGDGSANQCRRVLLQEVGRCPPDQKPEIVAPGVDILSTWLEDGYASATGTSQATPFVTSAVALLLEGRPAITNAAGVEKVKEALIDSARDLAGQTGPHDNRAGYGFLQAHQALDLYAAPG